MLKLGEYVKSYKNESLSIHWWLISSWLDIEKYRKQIKLIAEMQCYACRETQL